MSIDTNTSCWTIDTGWVSHCSCRGRVSMCFVSERWLNLHWMRTRLQTWSNTTSPYVPMACALVVPWLCLCCNVLLGGMQHKTTARGDDVIKLDMTEDDERQLFAEKPALKQLYDAKVTWLGQLPCHGIHCAMNCIAWHGMAWHGMAWHGMAWNGMEWNGMEWHGMYALAQATCTIPRSLRLTG